MPEMRLSIQMRLPPARVVFMAIMPAYRISPIIISHRVVHPGSPAVETFPEFLLDFTPPQSYILCQQLKEFAMQKVLQTVRVHFPGRFRTRDSAAKAGISSAGKKEIKRQKPCFAFNLFQ